MLHTPLSAPGERAGPGAPLGHGELTDPLRAMRGRLRQRAILDAGLLGLVALLAGFAPGDAHDGLRLALAALSLGLLLFVIRRGRDLSALARVAQAQQQAVAARGISLSQWQAGAALPAWHERG